MLSARVGVTLPDTIIKKVTQRRRKVLKQCVVNDSAFLVCFAFSSVITYKEGTRYSYSNRK